MNLNKILLSPFCFLFMAVCCTNVSKNKNTRIDSQSTHFSKLNVNKKNIPTNLHLTASLAQVDVGLDIGLKTFSHKGFKSATAHIKAHPKKDHFWQLSLCPTKSVYECKQFQTTLAFPSVLIPNNSDSYNVYARICRNKESQGQHKISCQKEKKIGNNIQVSYSSKDQAKKLITYRKALQSIFHFTQDFYSYIQATENSISSQTNKAFQYQKSNSASFALIKNIKELGLSRLCALFLQENFAELISNYMVSQDFYPRYYKESYFRKATRKYRLEDDTFLFRKKNLVKLINSSLLLLDQQKGSRELTKVLEEKKLHLTKTPTQQELYHWDTLIEQLKIIDPMWEKQRLIWQSYLSHPKNQIEYRNYVKAKKKLLKKYQYNIKTLKVHFDSQFYMIQNIFITGKLQQKLDQIRPPKLEKMTKSLYSYQEKVTEELEILAKPLIKTSIINLEQNKYLYKNINGTQLSYPFFNMDAFTKRQEVQDHLEITVLVKLQSELAKSLFNL